MDSCEKSEKIKELEIQISVLSVELANLKSGYINYKESQKETEKNINSKIDKMFWFLLSTGVGLLIQVVLTFGKYIIK